ncbi:unnamed protein product [Schistosoma mattheei]|uniref:Uncharacterized protein n=1 Tax=Schistosoma mattheei TaxID=31246 RepID=A0A183PNK5_9TREM|nr:unnamed protein product [Schistosoma mattheei]
MAEFCDVMNISCSSTYSVNMTIIMQNDWDF